MAKEKPKREPDHEVTWYCYWRLKQKRDEEGVSQGRIALDSHITPVAISNLLNKVEGVGPTTTRRLAKYLGFTTRGAMIDAADAWWNGEGSRWAMSEQRRMSEEKQRKLAGGAATKARAKRDAEAEEARKMPPRQRGSKAS